MSEHLIKAFDILNKLILGVNLHDYGFYDIDIFSLVFHKLAAIFRFINNIHE